MHEPNKQSSTPEGGDPHSRMFAWTNILRKNPHPPTNQKYLEGDESTKNKSQSNKWVYFEKPVSKDRLIELIFSGAIVISSVLQLITAIKNNESTSGQTDQLISAAKISGHAAQQNVQASRDFATSARSINGGIGDAVDKLNLQAQTMEGARQSSVIASQKSLDAAILIARQDQRAWLGASDYSYSLPALGRVESTANVSNTGRSPAIEIVCKTTGKTKMKGDELVESDIVYPPELPILKEGSIFPGQHFSMQAGGDAMKDAEKQKTWSENIENGIWVQYFYGEISYKDASGAQHWTHFCTQYVPAQKNGTPCRIYNDTDDAKADK